MSSLGRVVVVLLVPCGLVPLGAPGCGDNGTDPSRDAGGDPEAGPDSSGPADAGSDGQASPDADQDGQISPDAASPPEHVFGVTVTDPWVATLPGGELNTALDGLVRSGNRPPTARVVFDEGVAATEYVEVVQSIAMHASVMGELLDSLYVSTLTVDEYQGRACEYRATLGHLVDLWEVGNEVNGEWLGDGVIEKLAAATAVLTADTASFEALCPGASLLPGAKPVRIALTLYYNGIHNGGVPSEDNCWSDAAHAMDEWVDTELAAPGALGTQAVAPFLDTVLVSYYEDDCEGIQPYWPDVFDHLGAVFPGSSLGFGECGTTIQASKVAYVERYYQGMDLPDAAYANMHVDHPRFVGGYFWWYFSEDLAAQAVYGSLVDALASPFWAGP